MSELFEDVVKEARSLDDQADSFLAWMEDETGDPELIRLATVALNATGAIVEYLQTIDTF